MKPINEQIKSLVLNYFSLDNNTQITENDGLFDISLSHEHQKNFRENYLKITFDENREESNYELVSPGSGILSRILSRCIDFGPIVTAKLNSNEHNLPIIQFYFYVIFESIKSETQLVSVSVECSTQNIVDVDDSKIDPDSNNSIDNITRDMIDDCYIEAIDHAKKQLKSQIQNFKDDNLKQKNDELQNINSEFKKRLNEIEQKSQILRSKSASNSEFQKILDENESIKEERETVLKTLDKKYHITIDFALISSRILC